MSKNRFLLSFLATSILYGMVGYWLYYLTETTSVSEQKSPVKTIAMSVYAFQPEVLEEKPEPVEEETPPPVEEPPPEPKIEKPKPEPVVKKPEIKKPEVKKVKKEKPKKVVKKTEKKPQPVQKKSALKSTRKQQSTAAEKNLFLSKVRDRINRHKSYPRMAKRRGMEGSVKVDFTILANGNVSGITVSGPKAFHTSAKEAVQKAFPVSIKDVPLSLPQKVSITLHYTLSR
ncbi:energy transducer TonB [Sulfurovum sp.]|uniref:energy transducer TonB n=1 Tax=Sulfurovum sp. TaxID=1969726 RepID=UPI002A36F65D|nr:energy transducer TonB [Sulfurovum sp.]MDD2451047.1 energy transducer TonB [Sulfurovum sp.]MDD3500699.1 energy transducer TonB [Sulfurovum sp.]MDY0403837.1 energy transducer TonB [Sulfurovum sp.]